MLDPMDGFDWDTANAAKCEQHGLSLDAIEAVFNAGPRVAPDMAHSVAEQRLIAIGVVPAGMEGEGRAVFIAFTIREQNGARLIRPISARFMHTKEQRRYEQSQKAHGSGSADG